MMKIRGDDEDKRRGDEEMMGDECGSTTCLVSVSTTCTPICILCFYREEVK